jgi:hypothetical protein
MTAAEPLYALAADVEKQAHHFRLLSIKSPRFLF